MVLIGELLVKTVLALVELEKMTGYLDVFREAFAKVFGKSASIQKVVEYLHANSLQCDEAWLLSHKVELTRAMLKCGAIVGAAGGSAIVHAAESGKIGIIKLLLRHKAYIDAECGCALRFAAARGRFNVVKLLLESGADVHAFNDDAIKLAACRGYKKIVHLFESYIVRRDKETREYVESFKKVTGKEKY